MLGICLFHLNIGAQLNVWVEIYSHIFELVVCNIENTVFANAGVKDLGLAPFSAVVCVHVWNLVKTSADKFVFFKE